MKVFDKIKNWLFEPKDANEVYWQKFSKRYFKDSDKFLYECPNDLNSIAENYNDRMAEVITYHMMPRFHQGILRSDRIFMFNASVTFAKPFDNGDIPNAQELYKNKTWLKNRLEFSGCKVTFTRLDNIETIVVVLPENI